MRRNTRSNSNQTAAATVQAKNADFDGRALCKILKTRGWKTRTAAKQKLGEVNPVILAPGNVHKMHKIISFTLIRVLH